MAKLTRADVEKFKAEAQISDITASVSALPPGFIIGFEPSIGDVGTVLIGKGTCNISGSRVDKKEYLVSYNDWIANPIAFLTYYIYLSASGSYFVDIISPEYTGDYYYLQHPTLGGRFIASLKLKSNLRVKWVSSSAEGAEIEEDDSILRYNQSDGETIGGGGAETIYAGSYGGLSATETVVDTILGCLSASDPGFRTKGDFYGEKRTLFNFNYIFEDDVSRLIEIGPSFGIRAKIKDGTIVHDIPDSSSFQNNIYVGHLIFSKDLSDNEIYNSSSPPESSWTNVVCLFNNNSNVKGVLLRILIQNFTVTGNANAMICSFRPKGSNWENGLSSFSTPTLHDRSAWVSVTSNDRVIVHSIICPIGDDNSIQFYLNFTPTGSNIALQICQQGFFI